MNYPGLPEAWDGLDWPIMTVRAASVRIPELKEGGEMMPRQIHLPRDTAGISVTTRDPPDLFLQTAGLQLFSWNNSGVLEFTTPDRHLHSSCSGSQR